MLEWGASTLFTYMQGKHVLVTGGLGAIGSALCRALLSRGVASLTIIDDCSSASADLSRDVLGDARTTFLKNSIMDDAVLKAALIDRPQDAVFHLAAHFANQNSVDHPIDDCMVNSVGTLKVLEHCRLGKVSKFVFASSSCVYGNGPDFSVETSTFHLDTPYAINKLHGEFLTRFYHDYHGLNTTVLRYFNSFGPGEMPGLYRNVIPNFFRLAMQGKALPITGDLSASRDFNFVDNVIQGTLLAAERPEAKGKTYNIGSGRETSIGELAGMVNELTGNKAGIELKERRSWDTILRRKADISHTVVDLGYAPVVDLPSQLKATHEWIAANMDVFPQA